MYKARSTIFRPKFHEDRTMHCNSWKVGWVTLLEKKSVLKGIAQTLYTRGFAANWVQQSVLYSLHSLWYTQHSICIIFIYSVQEESIVYFLWKGYFSGSHDVSIFALLHPCYLSFTLLILFSLFFFSLFPTFFVFSGFIFRLYIFNRPDDIGQYSPPPFRRGEEDTFC